MIRQGRLCRTCTNVCKNNPKEPEAVESIEIECPECSGNGCSDCQETGAFEIDGCPNDFCRSVAQLATLADLFAKGIPPVAGGALDQSNSFIEAVRILESEEAKAKAEAYGQ